MHLGFGFLLGCFLFVWVFVVAFICLFVGFYSYFIWFGVFKKLFYLRSLSPVRAIKKDYSRQK